jgi:hypothetical protein
VINQTGQMVCDGPFCNETTALTFDHPVGWLTTRYDYKNWADFCGVSCASNFMYEIVLEDYALIHHNID